MSSDDAGRSGNPNLQNAGHSVATAIVLTSSGESDEEGVWQDVRQTPIAQRSIVVPKLEPGPVAGLRPAGGFGVMPMHGRRSVEEDLAHEEMESRQASVPRTQDKMLFPFYQAQPAQAARRNSLFDVDADFWDDYMVNEDGELEVLPRAVAPEDVFLPQLPQPANNQLIPQPPPNPNPLMAEDSRDACIMSLMSIFPGICLDHLSELYEKVAQTTDQLVTHILDQSDKGIKWPKEKDKEKSLKRKRVVDEDEEAAKKYGAIDRIVADIAGGVRPYVRSILMQEFEVTPANFIDATLSQNNYRLFSVYRILEEAHRTYDESEPPYNKIKNARKMDPKLQEAAVASTISNLQDPDIRKIEVLEELQAARRLKKKGDTQRAVEAQKAFDEEQNVKQAEFEGTMVECGCCCCDYPRNRMVHCDSEAEMHWFCRNCARMTAEVEIGKSKYELRCMSTDKCEAGFSMNQRDEFLDANTKVALERNEQEANLRLAGIENLASCPFCPYAAEYPPVEIDREFRCQAEDCEKVSCRLCKLESHIPKSCEEFAKENGLSIRRQIEEAMSAALIRKCNKCSTPFVKEEGCNKMTCTRNGCMNIQCYVCSKSCGYDHFNDVNRGGKTGNCPLFEQVEQRHEDEVKKAEKDALNRVLAEHPEYTAEDLRVQMSENVKLDDDKRKQKDPRIARQEMMLAAMRNGQGRAPHPGMLVEGGAGMERLQRRPMADYQMVIGAGRVLNEAPRRPVLPPANKPDITAPVIAAPEGIVQAQYQDRIYERIRGESEGIELPMAGGYVPYIPRPRVLPQRFNAPRQPPQGLGGGTAPENAELSISRDRELRRAQDQAMDILRANREHRLAAARAALQGLLPSLPPLPPLPRIHPLPRAGRAAIPEPVPTRDRARNTARARMERYQNAAENAESMALRAADVPLAPAMLRAPVVQPLELHGNRAHRQPPFMPSLELGNRAGRAGYARDPPRAPAPGAGAGVYGEASLGMRGGLGDPILGFELGERIDGNPLQDLEDMNLYLGFDDGDEDWQAEWMFGGGEFGADDQ